jgi:hypothetical protein
MQSTESMQGTSSNQGPHYVINIEGTGFAWDRSEITVAELRALGSLGAEPVVEIDLQTNSERELNEAEVVHVKPGMGYSKKVRFKRGLP